MRTIYEILKRADRHSCHLENTIDKAVQHMRDSFEELFSQGLQLAGYSLNWCMENTDLIHIAESRGKYPIANIQDVYIEGCKRFSIVKKIDYYKNTMIIELDMEPDRD